MDFIRDNSLVFDSEDENKLAFTEIHQNYGKLVESLLESHLNELGILPEQFSQSCSLENAQSSFHEGLFELVIAADDYELFRHLMVQKNIELELQALEVLQQQLGTVPESMKPIIPTSQTVESGERQSRQEAGVQRGKEEEQLPSQQVGNETTEYEENLARAIAESQTDREREQAEAQLEQLQLEQALALSLKDMEQQQGNQSNQPPAPKQLSGPPEVSATARPVDVPAVNTTATASSKSTTASSLPTTAQPRNVPNVVATTAATSTSSSTQLPEVDQRRMLHTLAGLQGIQPLPQTTGTSSNASSEWLKQARADIQGVMMTSPEGIAMTPTENDIKKRQEYLRALRDKVQAAKESKRPRNQDTRPENVRQAWPESPPPTSTNAETNKRRKQQDDLHRARALADTLKREVIQAEK